jgi:hypothetical protein
MLPTTGRQLSVPATLWAYRLFVTALLVQYCHDATLPVAQSEFLGDAHPRSGQCVSCLLRLAASVVFVRGDGTANQLDPQRILHVLLLGRSPNAVAGHTQKSRDHVLGNHRALTSI